MTPQASMIETIQNAANEACLHSCFFVDYGNPETYEPKINDFYVSRAVEAIYPRAYGDCHAALVREFSCVANRRLDDLLSEQGLWRGMLTSDLDERVRSAS